MTFRITCPTQKLKSIRMISTHLDDKSFIDRFKEALFDLPIKRAKKTGETVFGIPKEVHLFFKFRKIKTVSNGWFGERKGDIYMAKFRTVCLSCPSLKTFRLGTEQSKNTKWQCFDSLLFGLLFGQTAAVQTFLFLNRLVSQVQRFEE